MFVSIINYTLYDKNQAIFVIEEDEENDLENGIMSMFFYVIVSALTIVFIVGAIFYLLLKFIQRKNVEIAGFHQMKMANISHSHFKNIVNDRDSKFEVIE